MYLRLSAEQHRGAVSLTLRAVPSVCGVTLFALNKSQELVIRCVFLPQSVQINVCGERSAGPHHLFPVLVAYIRYSPLTSGPVSGHRSPRFPSRPPPLVRCVWNVDLQNNAAVINLTTVDLDGPSHCTDKDSPASHIDTGRIDITKVPLVSSRPR